MPETRSPGALAGSKRQQQSLPSTSQKKAKGVPSVRAVYTEEDFLVENYHFTESELKAAGYTSWKQYEVWILLHVEQGTQNLSGK
ncbi:hypothetical protein WJX77_002655 [Trebouxia sp. C0004]